MKRTLLLALLTLFVASGYAEDFRIPNFSGGMYSYPSSNKIPDNAAAFIQNFYTDIEPIAIERNGYEKRDTTVLGGTKAVTGLWEFQDNSGGIWIVSFSSRTFYKNTAGNTPTAFGPIATVDQIPDCAVNLGKFWCVNGTDAGWYFDGTSTATVSGMPLGTLIEPWRTRLVVGNITSARSTLRFSEDGDGTSWTLGGEATDPFSVQIGGANDGFNVTCLWGSFQDNLIAARKNDVWAGSGFDQEDFALRAISKEVGCIQTGTMREVDGSLIFMSNRGLEEMRGYTIQNISEPVRNITDELVRNTANSRSVTLTTQSDFSGGTVSGNLTTSIFAGSVAGSTAAINETASADFTGTNAGTVVSANSIAMAHTTNKNYYHERGAGSDCHSFEDGCLGEDTPGTAAWVEEASGGRWSLGTAAQTTLTNCGTVNPRSGSRMARITRPSVSSDWTMGVTLYDNAGNNVSTPKTLTVTDNVCTYQTATFVVSSTQTGKALQVRFRPDFSPSGGNDLFSQWFISSGNNITFYYLTDDSAGAGFPMFVLDDFTGGVTESTATYTSRTYDTQMTTNTVTMTGFTYTKPSGSLTPTFELQTSSNATNWSSLLTSSGTTAIGKRYLRVVVTFDPEFNTIFSPTSDALSTVDDFSTVAIGTGVYTSPVISIGNLISAWSPLNIDSANNGGTIQFEFNTSTSSTAAEFNPSSWTTVVSGNVPTNATNPYAIFRASFSVTTATNTPILNAFTVSWNEGGTSQPLTSWNYDRRYWLSFTTNTASGAFNDRVLLYQRNKSFTLFQGINAASFTTWRDNMYFGNSNGTGYVYKFDTGSTDDGTDISSFIRTKSYDFGLGTQDKDFRNVYVEFLGNSAFTGTFDLTYDIDQSGSSYSLGSASLIEGTGQVAAKFPFPMDNPLQGREIQYTLSKSGTGNRLKLYGIKTVFSILEER